MATAGVSVFEFAIKSEEEGAAFYETAAAGPAAAADGNLAAFLKALAADERVHAAGLRKLRDRMAAKGAASYFESAEVDDYLDAVIRGGLFESAARLPDASGPPSTIEDFYRIAIRAERSSILLYQALIDQARDAPLKKALKGMLADEKRHLSRVVALRADRDNVFAIERFGCMC